MASQITACSTEELAEILPENIVSEETEPTLDVSLSWTAPAKREDNQPISLSDIAGYKVYYGTKEGDYNNNVDVNDHTATGYTFKKFTAGTYYFVVTTYDVDGLESAYSTPIQINI
jgi:carbohydrate-selective porin OprB